MYSFQYTMDKKSIKNNNTDYNPVHKHKATQSTLQLKLDEFLSRNFADDRTFVVLRGKKTIWKPNKFEKFK